MFLSTIQKHVFHYVYIFYVNCGNEFELFVIVAPFQGLIFITVNLINNKFNKIATENAILFELFDI